MILLGGCEAIGYLYASVYRSLAEATFSGNIQSLEDPTRIRVSRFDNTGKNSKEWYISDRSKVNAVVRFLNTHLSGWRQESGNASAQFGQPRRGYDLPTAISPALRVAGSAPDGVTSAAHSSTSLELPIHTHLEISTKTGTRHFHLAKGTLDTMYVNRNIYLHLSPLDSDMLVASLSDSN